MSMRVSSKGWVVIPAELRERYKLQAGSVVEVVDYGGVLAIVPIDENPIDASSGMLAGGSSLTQALLEEHSREIEGE